MQKSSQNTAFERGFFRKIFREFDEQTFFNALQERLQEQPYHRKNRGLKNTVLAFSYVLNIISALSACYLIFWLTETLTGITLLAYVIAAVFLFFLEKLKRKSSNEFFQIYFFQKRSAIGWLALSLICFALSVSSTYFGAEQGTKDFSPEAPTLSKDATETEIKSEIATLDAENKKYEKQVTKEGIIYFPLQRSIERNKKTIALLRERLNNKELTREADNELNKTEHLKRIDLTATTLAWILVFLEVIFECCIAYIWYYYYRSFIEWSQLQKRQTDNQLPQNPATSFFPENSHSPPTPDYSQNGNGVQNSFRAPLGFFTDAQRDAEASDKKGIKPSVQAQTGLYREDLYTIPHTYRKSGKEVTVHYTKPQVQARLNQYRRELEEARDRSMSPDVIINRKNWVKYWSGKLSEIESKL